MTIHDGLKLTPDEPQIGDPLEPPDILNAPNGLTIARVIRRGVPDRVIGGIMVQPGLNHVVCGIVLSVGASRHVDHQPWNFAQGDWILWHEKAGVEIDHNIVALASEHVLAWREPVTPIVA